MGGKRNFFRNSNFPNLNNLDIIEIFGLFKTSCTILDRFMTVKKEDGTGDAYYVFWDINGAFSDSSPTSIYPSTVITSDFGTIKGSVDWAITGFVGHITGVEIFANNSVNNPNLAYIAEGGVITTDPENGLQAVKFRASRAFNKQTFTFSEMDSGNNWSSMTVCNPDNDASLHNVFTSTKDQTDDYFDISLDRTANKDGVLVKTPIDTYDNDYIDLQNTAVQKRILATINSSREVDLYLNNTLQSSSTFVGDYQNSGLKIGGGHETDADALGGFWQLQTIHSSALDTAQRLKLDDTLTTYFGT